MAAEDVAVTGVELIARGDMAAARIVPSGQELEMERENGAARVKLPPVGL